MNEDYGPRSMMCHPFFSMMGDHAERDVTRAVARRLLAPRYSQYKELKGQCAAMEQQLHGKREQWEAMKPVFAEKLPELLKPVWKKLRLKSSAWNAHVYQYDGKKGIATVELKHKTDKSLYKTVEVPLTDDMKTFYAEWDKVTAERDAIEKLRGAVGNGIDVATEKLESELYDLATQQQAEQFLAKLDKLDLCKLKAIAQA